MTRSIAALCLPLVLGTTLLAADKQDRPIKHTEIEGLTNHIAIKYLPEDRYSGDETSPRGDYEGMLSLHLPPGEGPFPVVFYVHGGSYTGGTKEGQQKFAQLLAKRGIAYCGFNYILQPKGIFPQVYWDFHNAARFLRANAAKYKLDPLRFGAYGLSAGGWLISSASMPSGDHFQTGKSGAISVSELAAKSWVSSNRKRPDEEYSWLKPMRDPAPAWPGEFGGFSALAVDFQYHMAYANPASPALQVWVGMGHKPKEYAAATANGAKITLTELTAPGDAGRHVHLPPFFRKNDKENAETIGLDGAEKKELAEVIADFFARELVDPATARAPAPEIYPMPRIVSGPTEVSMLAPRAAQIRYTTDGSDPTPASPAFAKPFTVAPGTVVKAITVAPRMQPSGVHTATFLQGPAPAQITGPATLAPGVTGQSYSVTFTASTPSARWMMNGDLAPKIEENGSVSRIQNGMSMDRETGVWSGTPTKPGTFWLQVWVNEKSGMAAGYRNYRWTITGNDLSGAAAATTDTEDRNQTFARLKGWPADQVTALLAAFNTAKLRVVSPDTAGDDPFMLVVHADDRAKAEAAIKAFIAKRPDLAKGVEAVAP